MGTPAPVDSGNNHVPVTVLLSGGLDSGCCLPFFLERGNPVRAIHFSYGQAAAAAEQEAAKHLAQHFGVGLQTIATAGLPPPGLGEVRGRNAFFLFGALVAMPEPAGLIALGIHSGTDYYDCARSFVDLVGRIFDGYSAGRVNLIAPFLDFSKRDIYRYADSIQFPIAHSYSCRRGTVPPCGECLSCIERGQLNALSN